MKRLTAGTCLLILLVGVPALILVLAGAPFVPRIDSAGISRALESNYLSTEAIVRALGMIAWAVWSYLTFVLMLEVAGRAIGSKNQKLSRAVLSLSRGATPLFVRKLIDVAIGGAFVAAVVSPTAIAAAPSNKAQTLVSVAAQTSTPIDVSDKTWVSDQIGPYQVKSGDCLWRIAGKELHDPTRWREIFELNRGRSFSDGRALVNPNLIHPGWVLELPEMRKEASLPGPDVATVAPEDPVRPTPIPGPMSESNPPNELQVTDSGLDKVHQVPPAVIVLPSGSALAGSFVAGMLTAHALARLRHRRRRRVSDPGFGSEPTLSPKFVADLARAWASPNVSEIDAQGELLIHEWVRETGAWPEFLAAIEESGHVTFELQPSSSETTPRGSHRVQFDQAENHITAEIKGQFVPMLKRGTPFERELLIALGATEEGKVIHLGFLSAGVISVSGPKSEIFFQQAAASICAGCPGDAVDMRLLGDSTSFALLADLPHIHSVSDWSGDALSDLEAELLSRERLLLEAATEDLRVHLATHPEAWAPVLTVAATEPPIEFRERVDQISQRIPQLGGVFIAVGWRPSSSRVGIEVANRVEHDLGLDTVSGPLWPLLLSDTEMTEAIALVCAANGEGTNGQQSNEKGELLELPEPVKPELELTVEPRARVSEELVAREVDDLEARSDEVSAAPSFIEGAGEAEASTTREMELDEKPPEGILEVRCFGALTISRNTRNYTKWRENAKELLAYLVSHPTTGKDVLIDELIPNFDDLHAAEKELSRRASQVRTKVSQMGERAAYLIREGDTFRIDKERIWSDVWVFDALLTNADRADPEDAINLLDGATSLYRGEFCTDCYFGPWLEAVRTKYRERFARASMRLADLLLERSEPERALSAIDRAIELDRVNEELHRKGIYIDGVILGRASWGRKRFQDLKTTLRDELDEEPDFETQQLMMSIEKRAK